MKGSAPDRTASWGSSCRPTFRSSNNWRSPSSRGRHNSRPQPRSSSVASALARRRRQTRQGRAPIAPYRTQALSRLRGPQADLPSDARVELKRKPSRRGVPVRAVDAGAGDGGSGQREGGPPDIDRLIRVRAIDAEGERPVNAITSTRMRAVWRSDYTGVGE